MIVLSLMVHDLSDTFMPEIVQETGKHFFEYDLPFKVIKTLPLCILLLNFI